MSFEEGGWGRPVEGDPRAASGQPGYPRPGYQQQAGQPQQPRYPQPPPPGYPRQPGDPRQPGYQQRPGYQQPGYQQRPGYQPQPGYQQRPGYQQPGYQQHPDYQQPHYRQPGYQQPAPQPVSRWGGATGNERLTAMTGAVLLVLLVAEGFTILGLRQLLTVHFFIGMLLIGPVALKAGSTIYRFTRYYTGHPEYKRKGPPAPLLRILGPFIVLLTTCVIGSGVMLAVAGPAGQGSWLFLHKASFALWFCAMTLHVLWYVPRLPRLLSRELRGVADPEDSGYAGSGRHSSRAVAALGGRGVRLALLAGSLLCGLVIAMLSVHLAGAWQFSLGY